ncbi:MAG: 1-acyl-sn-glycerol-3-phosphate acyltransferase, partial [Vicinamibacteraceae bacterium]
MLYFPLMLDEITQAVLSREEVARYLRGTEGLSPLEARERIYAYLDELRTTQRYHIYRALKHPLYPILRKLTRIGEGLEHVERSVAAGRTVYVSNHKSHLDYLIGPLVLEDYAIRPPIIAAGINLFGGAFGLINRHVTGAIPIRRNARDPVYLATQKAYVAEILEQHDLLFYPEGGRSYTGDLKPFKTGLLHATLLAENCAHLQIVPCAISYDLVLEDRTLARQGVKRQQRPFTREIAEMVGSAVGYETRAFVTFGPPISMGGYRPDSRRDVLQLARLARERVGQLYKVLPSALVATAMRPSIAHADLRGRVEALTTTLMAHGANLDVNDPTTATERGVELLCLRGVIVRDGHRLRVRDRAVLRYYA